MFVRKQVYLGNTQNPTCRRVEILHPAMHFDCASIILAACQLSDICSCAYAEHNMLLAVGHHGTGADHGLPPWQPRVPRLRSHQPRGRGHTSVSRQQQAAQLTRQLPVSDPAHRPADRPLGIPTRLPDRPSCVTTNSPDAHSDVSLPACQTA